jgi:hypothetical protein
VQSHYRASRLCASQAAPYSVCSFATRWQGIIKQMTANIILLDRFLEQYGPETSAIRNLLRRGVAILADRMWRENNSDPARAAPFEASVASQAFYLKLQELSPQNDFQRSLQARAIQIGTDIAQTRLAAVRADGQFDSHALPGGADFLAHHHLCKLQSICPT